MSKAITIVLSLLVIAGAVAAYMNLFSDDAAVRTQAEAVARKKVSCTEGCKMTRMEGSRGILSETISFTFSRGVSTTVTCRRQYIAVGAYACE
jgi:hypothetical protein